MKTIILIQSFILIVILIYRFIERREIKRKMKILYKRSNYYKSFDPVHASSLRAAIEAYKDTLGIPSDWINNRVN